MKPPLPVSITWISLPSPFVRGGRYKARHSSLTSLPRSGRGEPSPTGVSTHDNRSHRARHRAAGGACNAFSRWDMCTLSVACQEDTRRAPFKTISQAFKWGGAVLQKRSHTVVCPAKAGVFSRRKTYQGKSQSPGARRAGGRETNLLKPLDRRIYGMGARLQAVAQANAQVASQVSSPGGRACNRKGEGSMGRRRLADATDHSGGVGATAWGQGHAKQLERPAASRREIGGSKGGCRTGPPGSHPKTRGGRMGP